MSARAVQDAPAEAARRLQEALSSGSATLNLSSCGLAELPAAVAQLTQLQSVDVSFNQLTTLPLMKEVQKVLGVASPVIGKTPNLKDLAEGWTDKLSKPLGLLPETGEDPQRACGTALAALRQALLLKSQYLWMCEEHAMRSDYQP
jgi:hypothetical protein